ncbi:MAG: transcriptional repressor [Bullifex sp.]
MYTTRQKEELIGYLKENKEPKSATEISDALSDIGKSTVFRLLQNLDREGTVRSYSERRTRYYVWKDSSCHEHLHASCRMCGRYIHLDHETSEKIERLMEAEGMVLDEGSVIQALCTECREKGKK